MKQTKSGQFVLTDTHDVQALDLIREARVLLHRALEIQTHGDALSAAAGFSRYQLLDDLDALAKAQDELNRMETLITQHVVGGQCTVRLYRTANKGYIVEYGKQRKVCPTWQQAAKEFGECLFHALECEGEIERP